MSRAIELTGADTALLALLCERPMHPWELQTVVKQRSMRFWTDLSQSTIYKQLRALARAGHVTCRQEIVSGRLRKVYLPTRGGRAALARTLRGLLSEPEHLKFRVDLGTYNIDLLPRRQAVAALTRYRRGLAQNLDGYRRLEAYLVAEDCPRHRLAVARRPAFLLRAELRWVDQFLAALGRTKT